MFDFGKVLIMIGVLLIGLGVLVIVLGKIPGMGRLPGDLLIKKENFTFYFPLTTCILLSLIASLLFYLFRKP
ncbi:MAG: DUF2905 domain-containing protein [Candidatus Omnitrophota bacterium]